MCSSDLPDGVMGNSEVGHENIGAGRIVDQELVRLNKLFSEKRLATNAVWRGAIARVKLSCSPPGVTGKRMCTGFEGKVCAKALAEAKASNVVVICFRSGRWIRIMSSSLRLRA